MKSGTVCLPDCPDRSATCHSTCKKYLAAWAKTQERYAEEEKERRLTEITSKAVKARLTKMGKKQKMY